MHNAVIHACCLCALQVCFSKRPIDGPKIGLVILFFYSALGLNIGRPFTLRPGLGPIKSHVWGRGYVGLRPVAGVLCSDATAASMAGFSLYSTDSEDLVSG